jgi:RNA polymerase sigma-70 factor (ECF subfamily)
LNSAFDATRELAIPDLSRADRAAELREYVEQVFGVLHAPVFHYLMSLTRNIAEAEDLTQEVFLRLHAELSAGRRIESMKPWCFKVAHNLAASAGRRIQTEEHYLAASTNPEGCAYRNEVEDGLLRREQTERVSAAMKKLTPMERQCLYLRTQGLIYREIADVLGIRVPTVQTFVARSMKKVVKELHD